MDALKQLKLAKNGYIIMSVLFMVLGAYVIQFLTTTLYKFNVKSEAISAYKAIVVIILVVISAPVVREKIASFSQKMKVRNAKEVG